MKKRVLKRILSGVITLLMIISMVPTVGASAAEAETAEIAESAEGTEVKGYYTENYNFGYNDSGDEMSMTVNVYYEIRNDLVIITDCVQRCNNLSDYIMINLVIPSTIAGCPVEVLDGGVFEDCSRISNVTIPDTVQYISLTTFNDSGIYENPDNWDGEMLYVDDALIYAKNTETVETCYVKPGTRIIAAGAFYGAQYKNVTLPEGLEIICEDAFVDCGSLESINLPESLIRIGSGALRSTYNIEEIYIPAGVRSIGEWALNGISTCIEVDENNEHYRSVDGVLYNKEQTELIRYPHKKEGNTYTIPSGVTKIACNACDGNHNLEKVVIPSGVKEIGDNAFNWCKNLETVVVPDGLEIIGACAFTACYSLKNINIPDSVLSIEGQAFMSCKSLESIVIPSGITEFGWWTFGYCSNLSTITIPSSVTSIGDYVFYGCESLTDVYYRGTQQEWEAIAINFGNDTLLNAAIHFLPEVEFNGSSVTLCGNLGVNFYMEVPEDVLADEDTTVIFTYGENTEKVPASSGEQTDHGYKYTCNIPAKEMVTEVTCIIEFPDGAQSNAFTYTVKDYAETILSDPGTYGEKAVALVKSMLNYGAAAQEYFGHNTDALANDSVYMTQEDKGVEKKDFSDLSYSLVQGKEVQYYGTALSLKSEVGIKHYFTLSEGVNPDDVTVTVDGTQAKLVKNGNLYMVLIPNVAVHKLYTKIDVAVGDTTISYCVMDYAKTAQEAGKQELLKIMYALDVFAQNAVAYKE